MSNLKEFLLNPSNYPEMPREIKYFETHISQVFVGDRFVYKIKKPVDFGFLNFTTLKKRQFYVKREVLLNSRLAKDLYLGVKKIYSDGKLYSFQKKSGFKVAEYAVYMKRINEEQILFNLIRKGDLIPERIKDLGALLAEFHKSINVYRGNRYGSLSSVRFNTEENFSQVKPFIGKTIDEEKYNKIADYTRNFLKKKKELIRDRNKNGFVREVHGDLHSQHICLEDEIKIFDCIEFNNRFRISDILEDIAFLLMDLEFNGRFDLSAELEKAYFNHYPSAYDESLLTFYKVYRAYVRGKIEGFISEGVEDSSVKSKIIKKAADYFGLAEFYIKSHSASFNPLIFMGISGSGKSTISDLFKDKYSILRSDEIRKELAGVREGHHYLPYGEGIYSEQFTVKTYEELIKRGIKEATAGKRVILDATFLKEAYRQKALRELTNAGLTPLFVNFFAPAEILRERILKRMKEDKDISDAHLNILEKQLEQLKPIEDLPSFRLMQINSAYPAEQIRMALARIL